LNAITPNEATPAKSRIMKLQGALLALPQAHMPKFHHFAEGVYARELHIPKGVCLVGRIHLKSQVNIVLKGEISVVGEDGSMKHFSAPCVFVSPSGTKRAGYAHEDTIWITVLGTEKTDPQEIYDELTALDFDEYKRIVLKKETTNGV
jgi:hypothetical protein